MLEIFTCLFYLNLIVYLFHGLLGLGSVGSQPLLGLFVGIFGADGFDTPAGKLPSYILTVMPL